MNPGRLISPLLGKVLTIGVLTLLLLIPLSQVRGLIGERVGMRNTAVDKVAQGWGRAQVLGAPILSIPIETIVRDKDQLKREYGVQRILMSGARIEGSIQPKLRHVGIYSVPVYSTAVRIDGQLRPESLRELSVDVPGRTVRWELASVFLPIADPKGIRQVSLAQWAGRRLELQPGHYDTLAGVSAPVDLAPLRAGEAQTFAFNLEVAGSSTLRVLPLAHTTEVDLKSPWPDPGFAGAYTPAHYRIDDKGFEAHWQVLELNREFPQSWLGNGVDANALQAAAFGIDLFQSVDTYHRNERAVKYAVLFIILTFMSVFLWELASGARIHAMQYLLVGFALSVFYLLLLALSEHLPFAAAYAVSAGALTAVIGVYLAGALRSSRAGVIAGGAVATVYGLLYMLVQSEQYALLLGALLLFAVLAAIMLLTRRYDWHEFGRR